MYLPAAYKIENLSEVTNFIHKNNLGDLVTNHKQVLTSNKVPFLFNPDENVLYGHFGRNNSQLQDIEATDEVLAIFSGAHAYISPRWYLSENTVPTWNFETLQVRGRPSLINDEALISVLKKLSQENEQHTHKNSEVKPWSMNEVAPDKLAMMLKMIVGFKIEITDVKFKSKMSQNRNVEDQLSVIESLKTLSSEKSTPNEKAVATIMEKNLTR